MKCLKCFLVLLAFFLLILVFVIILMSRDAISDAAMDNVSFASSVVSIVLAVISIFISMYASSSTQGNLNSMKDVELKLNESIARLKGLKKDIHNFRDEIIPNPFGQLPTSQKPNTCFMMHETKKEKNEGPNKDMNSGTQIEIAHKDKYVEYMTLCEKALDKVEKIFKCSISRNYRLRNVQGITFDGVATISEQPYLFEVKIASSPQSALTKFEQYLVNLSHAIDILKMSVSVVVVTVCEDEKDKNATIELLKQNLFFPRLNLSILCFSKSDLMACQDLNG